MSILEILALLTLIVTCCKYTADLIFKMQEK